MIRLLEILKNDKFFIYCDLDSVLCDFDSMFVKISKTNFKDGWSYQKKYGEEKFWDIITNYGIKFWTNMPWMKDGKKLWSFINKNFKNVNILSAVPTLDTAHGKEGKIIWCKKNLGSINVILEKNKYLHSKPNHILIDDLEKNINPWISSGGIGILHKSANNTINELKKLI